MSPWQTPGEGKVREDSWGCRGGGLGGVIIPWWEHLPEHQGLSHLRLVSQCSHHLPVVPPLSLIGSSTSQWWRDCLLPVPPPTNCSTTISQQSHHPPLPALHLSSSPPDLPCPHLLQHLPALQLCILWLYGSPGLQGHDLHCGHLLLQPPGLQLVSMELDLELIQLKAHPGRLENTFTCMSQRGTPPTTTKTTVSHHVTLDTCQEPVQVSVGHVKMTAIMSNT